MIQNGLNWEKDPCTNHWVLISPSLDVWTSVNSLLLDLCSKLKCMFRTCFCCLPLHFFSLAWRENYAIHSYSSWLLIFWYIVSWGKNSQYDIKIWKTPKSKVSLLNEPTESSVSALSMRVGVTVVPQLLTLTPWVCWSESFVKLTFATFKGQQFTRMY